jgi:hypothetical protein
MRAARRVFVVGALAALVVVLVPSAGAQTSTVTSVIGSANGLFAELDAELIILDDTEAQQDVGAQQAFTFGPTPSVTLPPTGGSVSDSVADVDEPVVDILELSASLLTAEAQGSLGPAGNASAESTVADLRLVEDIIQNGVGAQQLEDPIIAAELISASCEADLTGVSGSTTLAGASVLGTELEVEPPPNTGVTIPLPAPLTGSVSLILNRQTVNADGSLSVAALVIDFDITVPEVLTASGVLEIGPATCGVVEGVEVPAEVVVPAPAPAEAVPAPVRFTG